MIKKALVRFGRIYKRNALGAVTFPGTLWNKATHDGFFSFPEPEVVTGVVVASIVSILLIPISATLFAGIKSLIDFSTRTFRTTKEVELLSVDGCDSTVLATKILGHNSSPKSNSSRLLISTLEKQQRQLKKLTEDFNQTIDKLFDGIIDEKSHELDKMQDIKLEYSAKAVGSIVPEEMRKELRNSFFKSDGYLKLKKEQDDHIHQCKGKIINQVKDYIEAKHNNGKTTFNSVLKSIEECNSSSLSF